MFSGCCWFFLFLVLGFGIWREGEEDMKGEEENKYEEMNKMACNRGGKAVWWGLFRVWFGLEREKNIILNP